jgi:hypothetical protein
VATQLIDAKETEVGHLFDELDFKATHENAFWRASWRVKSTLAILEYEYCVHASGEALCSFGLGPLCIMPYGVPITNKHSKRVCAGE